MLQDGDPAWFVDYLATASVWTPEDLSCTLNEVAIR
jgi:hypothetical protein